LTAVLQACQFITFAFDANVGKIRNRKGSTEMNMKEIAEMIAQALVDRPETVSITSVDGNATSILKLSVGQGETGKLIGRQGRTANALRIILTAIASNEKKRVVLEIEDELRRPAESIPGLDPLLPADRKRKLRVGL
jgi:predicted RNA-binding protein YlqC (UPF0109 family)